MRHEFKNICDDHNKLLKDCYKLTTFMSRLRRMADEQANDDLSSDVLKGMGFEALIEVMINLMEADKRIGIRNYVPQTGDDYGIDGYGDTNEMVSRKVTVQIKYRSEVKSYLNTKDDLSNFVSNTNTDSDLQGGVLYIFTTAAGVNRKVFEGTFNNSKNIKVFGFNDIRRFIDINPVFWDYFRSMMNKD